MPLKLDFELPEDFKGNGNWLPEDFVPLRNMAKFERAFSRTPHKFNIKLITRMEQRENKKATFKVAEDEIGCIVANNASGRLRLPITPWILAHRFAHAMQVNQNRTDEYTAVEQTLADLIHRSFRSDDCKQFNGIGSLSSIAIPNERFTSDSPGPKRYSPTSYPSEPYATHRAMPREIVSTMFLTMRSARRQEMTTDLEPFAEMATQYIITGRVRLRAPAPNEPYELLEKDFMDHWQADVTPKQHHPNVSAAPPFTKYLVGSQVDNFREEYAEIPHVLKRIPARHQSYVVVPLPLPDGLLEQSEQVINDNMAKMLDALKGQVVAF